MQKLARALLCVRALLCGHFQEALGFEEFWPLQALLALLQAD